MVRHESMIIASIGGVLGLSLGPLLAAILTRALRSTGFSFSPPILTLVLLAVLSAAAGILAAILPARRASQLNVLRALQYE